uniref:Uncharacterized protein n=1 Tax=Dulem virus 202 TaxID=3145679 RepID=A0AAU8B5R7_9VIRU
MRNNIRRKGRYKIQRTVYVSEKMEKIIQKHRQMLQDEDPWNLISYQDTIIDIIEEGLRAYDYEVPARVDM